MGILDAILNLSPEQNRGLLASAAQMLQASGPSRTPTSFGQILGGGIMAGLDATQQARQQGQLEQLRAIQLQEAQASLAAQQRAREKQQRVDDVFSNSYRTAGAQAASLPGGPTVENAARIGEFQDGFDTKGAVDKLWSIDPMMALQLQQSMKKVGPKYDSGITWVNGPDGRPVAVRTADDGSIKQLEGLAPRDKLELANLGGRSEAYNPYALQPGQAFTRTASPDALLQASVAREGHIRADARAERANPANKPMSALQETKYRTQIAKDYQSANTLLANMADVERSAAEVKSAPGLKGATGLQSYFPSMPNSLAAQAEVKLQNLEGKVTQLGKAAAAQGGAVGPMAVQEWKIVRDMIAAIDPSKGDQALVEQIELVEGQARGAAARLRDAYSKQYSADFDRYPQFEELAPPSPAPNKNSKPNGTSKFSVTAPNGKTYDFPDAQSLANFKLSAGIR
jgi:hypothetical protein